MCFLEKNAWPAARGVDMLYRSVLLTVIIQINPLDFLLSVYVCEDGVYVGVHALVYVCGCTCSCVHV